MNSLKKTHPLHLKELTGLIDGSRPCFKNQFYAHQNPILALSPHFEGKYFVTLTTNEVQLWSFGQKDPLKTAKIEIIGNEDGP